MFIFRGYPCIAYNENEAQVIQAKTHLQGS